MGLKGICLQPLHLVRNKTKVLLRPKPKACPFQTRLVNPGPVLTTLQSVKVTTSITCISTTTTATMKLIYFNTTSVFQLQVARLFAYHLLLVNVISRIAI